jgi:2-polyprenyl-3-methyl-5-hydroxy-6-metoxy-1,4-benzoquinol methylase
MAEDPGFNVEQIADRIRERVRLRQSSVSVPDLAPNAGLPPAEAGHTLPESALHESLAVCNSLHSAVGTINPRPPGVHNQVIQLFKKIMRRMLTWYTRPLHEFHGAVTRTLYEISELFDHLNSRLERTNAELQGFGRQLVATHQKQQAFSTDLSNYGDRLSGMERNIRRLSHSPQATPASPPTRAAESEPMLSSGTEPGPDFDYFLFEKRFRGDESVIKDRQRVYLDYFKEERNVIDLGCGRGEFLEVMREQGIPAQGVEINLDMYLLCRDKGLEVTNQDLFSFLETCPEATLGGIFCSQVIEHLSSKQLLQLITLAKRKLAPGSPIVLETINPECLFALAHNFFLDPTHVRPVHPETLQFILQSMEFEDIEVRFSSPANAGRTIPELSSAQDGAELEQFNRAMKHVNQILFGYQDYAIIARR